MGDGTMGSTTGKSKRDAGQEVAIQHARAVHSVQTTREPHPAPRSATLLELVDAVSATAKDEAELVAVVTRMLATGAVKLRGNFQNEPVERIIGG